jgi:hypothetical protein
MATSLEAASQWQQGFDFRNTAAFVTDPPGDTYVLPTMKYPTTANGVTFGWVKTSLVQGRDRSLKVDPRLAGVNLITNGSPATFYVDLPSPGTYNLSLAMGDAGYQECWKQCQIQFLDGNTVLATLSRGSTNLGYFYDAAGNNWSAAVWPGSNVSQQVTLTGTRLTVVLGTNQATGDFTPIAFLGVSQGSGSSNFTMSASPASLSVQQGNQGTSTITTAISGSFNSAISLSASGVPSGTAVSFSPNPIPAPGAGSSAMTITVGATPAGTYPITVTGDGGGVEQNTTVTLTVTVQQQPNFTISVSPASLTIQQGNQGNTTITTTISGGFNSAIGLSTSGVPSGTTPSFNPNPIPAPGAGSSILTIKVGGSTPAGTYPVTVTGNGGGIQQSATVTLTVTAASGGWQQGFDFRNTKTYVTDPPGDTSVLATTKYPTTVNGVTFGWLNTYFVQGRDRNPKIDPRLSGVNLITNGSPATFHVDLPSPGTYNVSLAMGDASYLECWKQCLIQVLDGNTLLAAVIEGTTNLGYFYDAVGDNWSAAAWPAGNVSQQVTLAGTQLTVVVGTNQNTGDYTPIAFLGLAQASGTPNFAISTSPASLSVQQGNQGASTITTTVSGGFNSAIALSASGVPTGTTVSFNPNPIPAPGSGNSMMAFTVGNSTPVGSYPITLTGNGGGIQQSAAMTLAVTAAGNQGLGNAYVGQPYSFTLQASFGTPPYTYQLTSGTLPPGLSMDQSGNITGIPTTVGQSPFEVLVTDSSQPPQRQTFDYTLNVLIAVTTYHNDNYRSGANTNETTLNTTNVDVQTFGKRSVFAVQGYVYAQPLYVAGVNIKGTAHNLALIATEHDQVYAFDVNSGQQIWQTTFLSSNGNLIISTVASPGDTNCGDLVPEVGITGTPAIDTSTNTMYLVAKTKEYNVQTQKTTFYQTLHALDITTGLDKVSPQRVIATAPGAGTGSVNGVLTFDPLVQAQRPGLMIQNGTVFIAFASHCDLGTYHGWIMAFDENRLAPSGVTVDTPNGYEGGYWGGGSGLAADSTGSIYGATGNGYFDADKGGIDYGDSILRMTWSSASKTFTLADYFTPWDQLSLDQDDTDLGSGGLLLLPDQPGTEYPHLLVQAGKEGTIDLVSRDNMGHFHSGNDSQIVQTLPYAVGGIWGAPAFWNNNAYFGGIYDTLKAFSFDPKAQVLSSSATSKSLRSFNYPGPTPSVSASGNTNGIVWIVENDNWGGGAAVLRAYDATNLATELYNSGQNSGRDGAGLAVKFTIPTIADGYVFLGAENEVDVYGLLQ